MSAQDNLSPQQFYHGTAADLKPGEMVEPGHTVTTTRKYDDDFSNVGEDRTALYVHATHQVGSAWNYAQRAANPTVGRNARPRSTPRVYHVEPTGKTEPDPDGGNLSVRSVHPMRVIRDVTDDVPGYYK